MYERKEISPFMVNTESGAELLPNIPHPLLSLTCHFDIPFSLINSNVLPFSRELRSCPISGVLSYSQVPAKHIMNRLLDKLISSLILMTQFVSHTMSALKKKRCIYSFGRERACV